MAFPVLDREEATMNERVSLATMTYEQRCEAIITSYDDQQLLEEWEEAKRLDAEDRTQMARTTLMQRLNGGGYWEDRKRQRREQLQQEGEKATRRRALEEGAARAYPVGRQVAAERVRAGMIQEALASAAGIRRGALARIERNAQRLSFDEACSLANALSVPLDRFRSA